MTAGLQWERGHFGAHSMCGEYLVNEKIWGDAMWRLGSMQVLAKEKNNKNNKNFQEVFTESHERAFKCNFHYCELIY